MSFMVSVQGSKCHNCSKIIEDLAQALMAGCPNCKSRSFKFFKRTTSNPEPLKESLNEIFSDKQKLPTGAGIKILEKGKFQFDLKSLAESSSTSDTVIVEDHRGVINIIINSED